MSRRFGFHSGHLECQEVTVAGDFSISGDLSFGDAASDTLTVTGKLDAQSNVDLGQVSTYPTVTDDGTGDRKDGIFLLTGSRTSSGNPSDTQKFLDLNGTPGSNYNSWDIFTGAAAGEHTIILNIDAKRINTAATGAVTDRGLNISVENQTDSSGGTLDLVGAHIKAESDADGTKDSKLNDLKAMHLEAKDNGSSTIAGESIILELQAAGSLASQTTGDTSAIKFTGNDEVDFALNFAETSGCVGTGSALSQSGNIDGYITIQIGSNTLYINAYDAAPTGS